MIDIQLLRQNADYVQRILKKDPSFAINELLQKEENLRSLQAEVESLRSQKNVLAQQSHKGVTEEIRQQSIALGRQLKEKEELFVAKEEEYKKLLLSCPNIPEPDLPVGNKESNKVVREWANKPTFNFDIKNHVELGEKNQWFNSEAANKIAGSGFIFYQKEAVKLLYALAFFMLKHNSKHGFEVVLPPYLTNETSLMTAGNFPKFKEEVFAVTADNLYLIPTSEVCLTNIYRDEIIDGEKLPIRMTAWSSCFRREAGNYGKMERGLIRIHQFEKVELFSICEPENSNQELEKMVACAESLLQKLGLHYQVSLLATEDCSFQSAKTYDIEVWLPGQNRYYEVSSASNCTDFQARRGKIRYRKVAGEKPRLVHTLNASSLALPRLMVAIMETYQQADGSIKIPEVLQDYML